MKKLTKSEAEILLTEKGLTAEDAAYIIKLTKAAIPEVIKGLNKEVYFGDLDIEAILKVIENTKGMKPGLKKTEQKKDPVKNLFTANEKPKTEKETQEKALPPTIKKVRAKDNPDKLYLKNIRKDVMEGIVKYAKEADHIAFRFVRPYETWLCMFSRSEAKAIRELLNEILEGYPVEDTFSKWVKKLDWKIEERYFIEK